ncbi:MAG: insulinase family protein [Candidatus Handelsmanbacteria bacterium]|nr:insulinase family protein [Candidatus Handelsmanbacteria bacterium]
MAGADFSRQELGPGVEFFVRADPRFKTIRVDLFLAAPLRPRAHTRLALIGRLLERGTRRLPDLRRLNGFLDELFGANFAVEVEALGHHQLLHLGLEVVAPPYLPGREDLLASGVSFLGEVLADPAAEDGGFRRDHLRQEKKALAAHIHSLANDKSAYAHRRCLEAMCGADPCALPAHGDPADFRGIDGRRLLADHQGLLATAPLALFMSGQPTPGAEALVGGLVRWPRRPAQVPPADPALPPPRDQELFEAHEVSQGRLVLGYRTGIGMGDPLYPALLLFNALFGGDAQSLLFRQVREAAGLCYHIGTHLEPLCGLLFVEAGIDPDAYGAVCAQIEAQHEALRQGEFAEADLSASRLLLQRHLETLDDSPEALIRFCYQQRLAGLDLPRSQWRERLDEVDAAAVAMAAALVRRDTSFFLYPAQGAWRP